MIDLLDADSGSLSVETHLAKLCIITVRLVPSLVTRACIIIAVGDPDWNILSVTHRARSDCR